MEIFSLKLHYFWKLLDMPVLVTCVSKLICLRLVIFVNVGVVVHVNFT